MCKCEDKKIANPTDLCDECRSEYDNWRDGIVNNFCDRDDDYRNEGEEQVKHEEVAQVKPKFNVKVALVGQDGNAVAIMGRVRNAIRKAGATQQETDEFLQEATSGSYDNLIAVAMKWVNVV